MTGSPKDQLLDRVIAFVADEGIADKSLRQVAAGAGTSHRMLLHHFGSREGLLAAIVTVVETQQRETMAALAGDAQTPRELMLGLWETVSGPGLRPFVRLFFEVFGLAAQGAAGTESLLESLTEPWLEEGVAIAARFGLDGDATALRLGVAVSRGLLLELLAGADPAAVTASYRLFVDLLVPEAD